MAPEGSTATDKGDAASTTRVTVLPAGPYALGIPDLPQPRTPLIGRDVDVARVVDALTGAQLVTLTGAGGVGKTRVAIEVAHQLTGRFPDGAAFVPLAGVSRAADFTPAMIEALALAGATGRSAGRALRAGLRHRHAVVVLDNFEQLVDTLDDLPALLDACPGVRLLVTSRTVLRCDGEVVLELEPLPVPASPAAEMTPGLLDQLAGVPSVALFAQRAAALRASFTLDATTAPSVARVCRQVGGLPLAIELAAARLNVLSLPDLVARLERDPLAVLARGARDLPARQRSLRATLDWSLRLLGHRDRGLLERLAVFEHGFTLAAAETVCAGPASGSCPALDAADVLDGLAALVDAHLVEPDDRSGEEPRFALPVAVRDLVRERSAEGVDVDAARRLDRHILNFGATAGQALESPQEQQWLDRVAAEIDQIRSVLRRLRTDDPLDALALAADLGPFWMHRGLPAEGRSHLAAAAGLRPADDAGRAVMARAQAWDARLAAEQEVPGEGPDADGLVERLWKALEVARAVGTVTDVLRIIEFLSNVALLHHDDLAIGEAITAEGVILARAHDQRWWLAQLVQRSAVFPRRRGDVAGARGAAGEAMGLARQLGADRLVVLAGLTLAQLPGASGRDDVPTLPALLDLARSIRSPRSTATVWQVIATQALVSGDHRGAAAAYREAVIVGRDIGYRDAVGYSIFACAMLASATGDPVTTAHLHGAAETYVAALRRSIPGEYYQLYLDRVEAQRVAIGPAAFESEAAIGAAWTWEQLLAETIAFTDRLAGPRDHRSAPSDPLPLTQRELQILELMAAGKTNKDIARVLGLSPKTVMHHSSHIYRKLDVRGRSEAVALAARRSATPRRRAVADGGRSEPVG